MKSIVREFEEAGKKMVETQEEKSIYVQGNITNIVIAKGQNGVEDAAQLFIIVPVELAQLIRDQEKKMCSPIKLRGLTLKWTEFSVEEKKP